MNHQHNYYKSIGEYGGAAIHPEKFDQKTKMIPFYGRSKPHTGKEDDLQISVTRLVKVKFPKAIYYHVANEGIKKNGNHAIRYGAKRKRKGVLKGVADCQFDNARRGFHGLKIELKTKGESPKPEQIDYLTRCQNEGYFVAVCWNLEAVEIILDWYFMKF